MGENGLKREEMLRWRYQANKLARLVLRESSEKERNLHSSEMDALLSPSSVTANSGCAFVSLARLVWFGLVPFFIKTNF